MHGIGIDIVSVARIERIDTKYKSFRVKILAEGEVAHSPESLAGLWAAKEAVVKALGTGFTGFGPKSIIISKDAAGGPVVRLVGAALEAAQSRGVCRVLVSISHSAGVAVACAVAL